MNPFFLAALIWAAFLCSPAMANDNYDHVVNRTHNAPNAAKPNGKTAYLLNGLGTYIGPGPMWLLARDLEAQGYTVTIMTHMRGAYLDHAPDVLIGHSMGGNAVLKLADRLRNTKKKLPRLVITIDPGRAPLFFKCTKRTRCVNYYNPWNPIGGQRVVGAENNIARGALHVGMPMYPSIRQAIVKTVTGK